MKIKQEETRYDNNKKKKQKEESGDKTKIQDKIPRQEDKERKLITGSKKK